ncbi:FAD-dependent oxidoreductase [Haloarcula sp. 1CSR25-25]|uniref:NAD(P)/FAD-dependent oxidoreductase n=1 Tax=Haloarcula sp. 1CSR25-25 TaxID=2862545 RepID=UPI0028954696|nr:FAD-dependent oxidoreductase [Haloarcula sp. 1CSR25-25]MDT3436047.1 FAD-dependent oxidoreductase [Haloarcula sp. 1CSR25-25]
MTDEKRDLVIAGSGIAGLSAAVYAARADLDPLVLEGEQPGGQLTLTTDVENYLGFPDGVGGMELVQRGKEQAEQFGAAFRHGRIDDAALDGQPLELSLSTGDTIHARSLIVATGASARWVGAQNEGELMGHGLSTCATCDGAFHRGDDLLVIGGGDSAMEEALFLAKFADSVTIVHRREELRASEIMADRARDHDKIQFRWNTELEAVQGSQAEGVTDAVLVSHPDGYPREKAESGTAVERETVDVGGVFYAVGHTPNTQFLDGTGVERDESGYVFTQTDDAGRPTARTSVDGVFAAGDVADPRYRQAVTSAGTGSMAALDAEEFLETLRDASGSTVRATVSPDQSAP